MPKTKNPGRNKSLCDPGWGRMGLRPATAYQYWIPLESFYDWFIVHADSNVEKANEIIAASRRPVYSDGHRPSWGAVYLRGTAHLGKPFNEGHQPSWVTTQNVFDHYYPVVPAPSF